MTAKLETRPLFRRGVALRAAILTAGIAGLLFLMGTGCGNATDASGGPKVLKKTYPGAGAAEKPDDAKKQ